MSLNQNSFISLVKYPILTEKTIQLLQSNQYSFAVDKKANKAIKIDWICWCFWLYPCDVFTHEETHVRLSVYGARRLSNYPSKVSEYTFFSLQSEREKKFDGHNQMENCSISLVPSEHIFHLIDCPNYFK